MINKKNAYTLAETLITIIILGMVTSVIMVHFKPKNMSNDACLKASSNMYAQIDFGFKAMLARKSKNYTMLKLITADNASQFSITDDKADEKMILILKKSLVARRKTDISSTYLNKVLIDDVGITYKDSSNADLKASYFNQRLILKNEAIFGIHLNGNCTTTETTIFNPERKEKRTIKNSCGLVFFDVNGEEAPNILGIDQYIISIGKLGIK